MITIEWRGETLVLLSEGGLFRPSSGALVIADLHLGKAAAFRSAGIPVPAAVTTRTLDRLSAALSRVEAARLIVLGDLLHARHGVTDEVIDAFVGWRAHRPALEILLVRGNHDVRAGDPPPSWNVRCVDEPAQRGGLAMCHDTESARGAPCLAGHVHPAVVIRARDGFRSRRPCFWFTEDTGLLPAFGAFTGAHAIRPQAGDRVFALDGESVLEVTSLVSATEDPR